MTSCMILLIVAAVYVAGVIAIIATLNALARREQRRADLARIDGLCRIWKNMDQPRDKLGRYARKAKA